MVEDDYLPLLVKDFRLMKIEGGYIINQKFAYNAHYKTDVIYL